MKLLASQRSLLAECVCRVWIRRRGLRLKAPKVYRIVHPDRKAGVWGWFHGQWYITLHMGPDASRRDQYILLAHEFAHYLTSATTAKKYRQKPHGERFQRILWGTLPRSLWRRASSGRWVGGRSGHRPEFQPI
jgi:hypothetical protein